MWGGNLTYLDVLVRNQSLNAVRRQFNYNEISFDVIIDDLQKAIDEENPPITDDDELEIRQGTVKSFKFNAHFRNPFENRVRKTN